jgi:hypothetical protein
MTANADALALLSGLILEDGKRWGDIAEPFQWDAVRAILDPAERPNRWESRPRGGSKTTDAAAWLIALLVAVLRPGSECYAYAADLDQARRVRDFLNGFVVRTPGLASVLTVDRYRVTAASGSTLEIQSCDGASAFGLKPAFVLVDELAQWSAIDNTRTLWSAIVSAMGKVPSAKLAVITTSGDPGSWAHGIYLQARRSKLWTVAEIPGPLSWVDPAYLADQRDALMPSQYARFHLNQWAAGEDRLTNEADLEQCITLSGRLSPEPGRRYVILGDIGVTHDASVVAVMHSEPQVDDSGEPRGRRVVLDQLRVWKGTRHRPVSLADVQAQIVEFHRLFPGSNVVLDPHEAVKMFQDLRAEGVPAEEFTFSTASVGRLGIALFQTIRAHDLAIWRDEPLIKELLSVKLVERTPGNYRLDHSASGHDDMAVTLAMGCAVLLERPAGRSEVLFDEGPTSVQGHGQQVQILNGPFALSPADTFAGHLERLPEW